MSRSRLLDDTPFGDPLDRPLPPTPISYEDFLDWCDEDTFAEWVDGEIELMSPASLRHQEVAGFLFALFLTWAQAHNLGTVLMMGFQMRLANIRRGREPDVLFIAREHLHWLKDTYLDGPADLVVEVVSPESVERDRDQKRLEYAAAGIPEYWLIDLVAGRAAIYELAERGTYRVAFEGREGTYRSRVLTGLAFPMEWIWQDPPPGVRDILRHLGIGA